MTLWFVFALMTVAAIFAVLWPLSRGVATKPGGSEAVVYKDQLAEIDRDVAAGLIGASEAEAARVEIGRRLLAGAGVPRDAQTGATWYQLAADITIASDQAVFAQPEVRHISNTTFLLGALCGWKAANRWGLTGDHFDAQEALRIGMVNEVVPHDQLMDATRALAKRIALVPEPSVRLNKSITMLGMQAAGVYSGLLLEGALGALAHSSHNEFREKLFETQREHGLKAYLDMRDGPFQPEPMGPRSAKGRQKKTGQ